MFRRVVAARPVAGQWVRRNRKELRLRCGGALAGRVTARLPQHAPKGNPLNNLNALDYATLSIYVVAIMGIGLIMSRKAASSLEDYFLGGRRLPWYLLGASGMAMWFDATGTMIICSFLYMIGPRGLFIEFRGGAVLVLAFAMCMTGKWYRRSRCMTGAEWNVFRFGKGADADAARLLTAIMGLVCAAGMLAYLVRGVGLFLSMFLPFSPTVCAAGLVTVAAIYTMMSGFYGVVLTDLIQATVIVIAACAISFIATRTVSSVDELAALAQQVTGNAQWTESMPRWHTSMPRGYEAYQALIWFAMFYLMRNVLDGLANGAEPKFFAARSDRDCGLLSFVVGLLIMVRWPMMMGFAVLGLHMVHGLYPDPAVIPEVATLIKTHFPDVTAAAWHDLTSQIVSAPAKYPEALIGGLGEILGQDWTSKLPLIGFDGIVNPERILPAVVATQLPAGLRGIILVALVAASMSTFDSTVNMNAALFVRDIYQRWIRPRSGNRELIFASYIATLSLVAAGFTMGVATPSINNIWGWIIMSLTAGTLVTNVMRMYWWRTNGWGVAAGLFMGGVGAIVQRLYFGGMLEWKQLLLMVSVSFTGVVVGSLLTRATPKDVLRHFYRTTRPLGFWRPMRRELKPETLKVIDRELRHDVSAIPFGMVYQVALFLLPMQLVIHAYGSALRTLPLFLIGIAGLYWFWFRHLGSLGCAAEGLPSGESAEDVPAHD